MTMFYTLYDKSYETLEAVKAEAQALLEDGYSRAFDEISGWDTEQVYGVTGYTQTPAAQAEAAAVVGPRSIKVRYTSVDRCRETRTFKTLAGAQKYAQVMVGRTPTLGGSYAVSDDGIGKVTVTGATLREIFPNS